MIRILTTSYLDQTQAIGLNPILEYYGIMVYADIRATYKEFTVNGRQKEFNVIGRTKEFTVI